MDQTTISMPKILQSQARVRFQDADPFNHLNNSKYIDYLINAREDQVEQAYGLDFNQIAVERGLGWIVAQQQIAYLRPARTGERLHMESQLVAFSAKHLFVEVRMWDAAKRELKAFLWVQFMPIDLKHQRLQSHPTDLMELFEAVQLPLEQEGFEARSRFWRQHNRAQATT